MKALMRRLWGRRDRSRNAAPDPLIAERRVRAMFQGRRDGARLLVCTAVLLGDAGNPYRCETIDVSRTGLLLAFRDPRCREWDLNGYMHFLEQHLGQTVTLRMGGLEREINIVRVTQGGLGGSDLPQFACRFQDPISAEDLAALLHTSRANRAAPR